MKVDMIPDQGEDTGVKVMPEGTINPSALAPSEPTSTGGEGFAPSQSADYAPPMEPQAPEIDLSADDLEYGELVEPVETPPVAPTQEQDDDALYGELEEVEEDPIVIVGDEEETMATAGYDYSESVPNSFLNSMAQVESSWRYDVKADTTSATGLFQFIDSTWLAEIKKNFPEDVAGMSNAQILEMRKDPYMSTKVAAKFTEGNAKVLTGRGHEVTDGNLYLAHFLGANGASRALDVWNGDPSTPVAQAVKPNVIRSNPGLFDPKKTRNPITTVGGLVEWASRKMEKAGKRAKGDVATLLPVEAPKAEVQSEQQVAQAEPVQATAPQPTPVGDGIYEDPDTGKPFRIQGGRMYDLRTGERLDVDPVQDTGPDVGTIEATPEGMSMSRTLEGSLQDNLAGSGNASAEEIKSGVRELTGANLMKNVTEALDRGDTTGAALEVAFEGLPILGDAARAMFIGFKRAINSGANTEAGAELLQRAIDMEDAGKSVDAIKKELNMHRGADGAWRKELSDAPSEVKPDIHFAPEGVAKLDRMSGAVRFANRESMPTLETVFKHDELFSEYPDLRDVRVAMLKAGDSADGTMYQADGVLAIHPRLLKDEAKLRQTILHEIQHKIQAWEGFIGGGSIAKSAKKNMANARIGLEFLKQENPELAGMSDLALETMMRYQDENYAFTKQSPKAQEALRELATEYNKAKDALDKAYDDYLRIHGEAEARSTQYSADMSEAERAVRNPYTERNDRHAITDGRFLDERKKRL